MHQRILGRAAMAVALCVLAAVGATIGISPVRADASPVLAYTSVPDTPDDLAVSPDGARVYVAASAPGLLLDIDPVSTAIRSRTRVGETPRGIAFSPDGSTALVVNISSDTVSVMDVPTGALTRTIAVADAPEAVAFRRDGRRAYVTHTGVAAITVLDPASGKVLDPIPLPDDWTEAIATSPVAEIAVALMSWRPSSLAVISLAGQGSITRRIPIGGTGIDVAMSPDGTRAYVLDNDRNVLSSVVVVDLAGGTILSRTPVGHAARDLAISTDGSRVLVAHQGSLKAPGSARGANAPLISVFDAASMVSLGVLSIAHPRTLGAQAESLGLSPNTPRAWLGVYGRTSSGVVAVDTASPAAAPGLASRITTQRSGSGATIRWSTPPGSPTLTLVNAIPNAEGDAYPILTCTTTSRSCRVRGLIAGISYQLTVQARNANGWGPAAVGKISG